MEQVLKILKSGGKLLLIYWLCCGVISLFQNTIGMTISKIVGLEAPYALLASSISMIGGHGAALSYGSTFAEMGYDIAPLVGAAKKNFWSYLCRFNRWTSWQKTYRKKITLNQLMKISTSQLLL